MGRSGQYIMSKNVLTGLTRRYGSVQCKACGEPIKEGESVVSKQVTRNHVKLFHESCYEGLFLDL